jgi:hypothetical protein
MLAKMMIFELYASFRILLAIGLQIDLIRYDGINLIVFMNIYNFGYV